MLQFDGRWRFDSPGPIEPGVEDAFLDLVNRIAGQASRKSVLEHFKSRFAAAANIQYWPSSNERFAAEDLATAMSEAAMNAPLFIEAFWLGCEELRLRHPEMVLPDAGRINRILTDTNAGYQLDPPMLIATRVHIPSRFRPRPHHWMCRLVRSSNRRCRSQNVPWPRGTADRPSRKSCGSWKPSPLHFAVPRCWTAPFRDATSTKSSVSCACAVAGIRNKSCNG